METIKLSEVLSRYNKTEGLATDGIIISRNGETFRTQTRDLSQVTTSQAGIMGVEDKTYIESLKPWLVGSLGNFDSSEAFNNYLDGLSYDNKLASGRYIAILGGVPLFVSFSLLSAKDKILAVWVEGSLMVRKNAIGSNTGEGVTIAYRYYKNEAWGVWKTIYDDVRTDIPTAQTSVNGTTKNYIYSASGDEMHTALSGKIWIYQNGGYDKFIRFKHWGANNDENAENYSQVWLPPAWTGGNGLMRWDVYRRLDNFSLREENSTADAVNIVTPIFTTGGTRSFPISKATTAKAGVMSVAQVTALNKASEDIQALKGRIVALEKKVEALEAKIK